MNWYQKKIIAKYVAVIYLSIFCFSYVLFPLSTSAIANHNNPKTFNYYLHWDISESQAKTLSKWDVVVLDMELQVKAPSLLKKMRQWNPNIILLVYITSQEIRQDAAAGYSVMRQQFVSGIPESWYLHNSGGVRLSWWPGTYLLNVTNDAPLLGGKRYNQYMAEFVTHKLLSTGLWDGVFYDNAWDNITYFAGQDVDINYDGFADTNADAAWQAGMKILYTTTRQLTAQNILLVGNSDSKVYADELNGMLLENFPNGNWSETMQRYGFLNDATQQPRLNLINRNTANKGGSTNYRSMRFGLGSTLLGNGYYSYDFGDTDHGQLWYYDEYDIDLGEPMSDAISQKQLPAYGADVWRRDFEHGVAIVNSTNKKQWVELGGEFEKIKGIQDPVVNDGTIINETIVDGNDALVLLKTFAILEDVVFPNGAFVRFLDPTGARVRNGFFVFEEGYKGGDQIGHVDLDGDGERDLLVVSKNKVSAWRADGQTLMKVYPYTTTYQGQLRVAVGDLNNNGRAEVYVAPSEGYPAPIKVYTYQGRRERSDWFPFGEGYKGGYSLALGSLDGGTNNELVIGYGKGHEPSVAIYDHAYTLMHKWLTFDAKFKGGVRVAAGDVNGDGKDEVIVGAGSGKKPVIRIYDILGKLLYPEFAAYSAINEPGIDVRAFDVDFDGKDEIVGLSSGIGL